MHLPATTTFAADQVAAPDDPPTALAETAARPAHRRWWLWVLLSLALLVNAGSSVLGWPVAVGVVSGLVALVVGGVLVHGYLAWRRRAR